MSDVTAPTVSKKKRSRVVEYLGVVIILGIVVAAAFFQEQLSYYFGLKLWDKGAPARSVEAFLTAGKKGDEKLADSYLGSKDFKKLLVDGKWVGYFLVSQAGTMEYKFEEMAKEAAPKATETRFIYAGKGAAEVDLPDSAGKTATYRLEMQDGWKITEMLGGHPARKPASDSKKPAAPAPKKP